MFPEAPLEEVSAEFETLTERFSKGRFVSPDWLRRTLSRLRVTGRLSEMIYSMEATDTDFLAYQFKPVLKLLNSPTDGLLIADEVGLGKTIEAGLIWTELRARFDSKRLLVICPKTLCDKWQDELKNRFGVEASIVNAEGLLRFLESAQHKDNAFAAIASMQSLRPPKGWRNATENESTNGGNERLRLAQLLNEAENGQALFDLLVVGEAMQALVEHPVNTIAELATKSKSILSHSMVRDIHEWQSAACETLCADIQALAAI